MKFSKGKKDKIKKRNQRQVLRVCRDLVGNHLDHQYLVVDQARINDTLYLLAKVSDKEYAVYKVFKVYEYVKLSPKKVLSLKNELENHENWRYHTLLLISNPGEIKFAKVGTLLGPITD